MADPPATAPGASLTAVDGSGLLRAVCHVAWVASSWGELASGVSSAAAERGWSAGLRTSGSSGGCTGGCEVVVPVPVLPGNPRRLELHAEPRPAREMSEREEGAWRLAADIVGLGLERLRAEEDSRRLEAHGRRSAKRGQKLEAAVESERRRVTQLQVLNQLAITLNSEVDPGRMLDEVLAGALRLTGALGGSVYLPENGDLRLLAFTASPELTERQPPRRPWGVDVKELAREAMTAQRLVRAVGFGPGGPSSSCGYLAVPLITAEEEGLACLVLAGAGEDAGFSSEDEMLAITLAAHTAVALQNARRLAREHEIAVYLQTSMLPPIPRVPGMQIEVAYESATDATLVGGDFYDVIPVRAGRVAFVVGDVCGKGLRAATRMAAVRHTLRAYATLDPDPGEWLTLVNESLSITSDLTEFVSAALVVVEPGSGILEYVLAGHPAPLLVRPGSLSELEGQHDLPLGVRRGQRYHTRRAEGVGGATLVLFTDGLYEARVGRRMFGTDRLEAAVRALASVSIQGAAERLVAEARAFSGGHLSDDVVVMLVRLSGA